MKIIGYNTLISKVYNVLFGTGIQVQSRQWHVILRNCVLGPKHPLPFYLDYQLMKEENPAMVRSVCPMELEFRRDALSGSYKEKRKLLQSLRICERALIKAQVVQPGS